MVRKILRGAIVSIVIVLIFSCYNVKATDVLPSTQPNTSETTTPEQPTTTETAPEETPNNSSQTQTQTNTNNTTNSNTSSTRSGDATLNSLTSDIGEITPEFNSDITEYFMTVDLTVDQVNFTATPNDKNAKVNIVGYRKLTKGENTVTITITAQNGTEKKYIVHVTKVDNVEIANANLKSIEVENHQLSPEFEPDILNYNLNLKSDEKKLDVTALSESETASVEITGNDNLTEGENTILIKVTAEDGVTTKTYKIIAYVEQDAVKIEEESKTPALILLGILGIGIIISISIIIIKKNTKKR